jgi:hypothetical protein
MCSEELGYDFGSEKNVTYGDSLIGKWITPRARGPANSHFIPLDGLVFGSKTFSDLMVLPKIKNQLNSISHLEFFPVNVGHYQYWWINCTNKLDSILDSERSDIGTFSDFQYPQKWVFRNIEYPPLFTSHDDPLTLGRLFCTETVYKLSLEHNWIGMDFTLLYDSDKEPFEAIPQSILMQRHEDWDTVKPLIKAKRAKALREVKKRYPEGWSTSCE